MEVHSMRQYIFNKVNVEAPGYHYDPWTEEQAKDWERNTNGSYNYCVTDTRAAYHCWITFKREFLSTPSEKDTSQYHMAVGDEALIVRFNEDEVLEWGLLTRTSC
jgi:hypothetical protein